MCLVQKEGKPWREGAGGEGAPRCVFPDFIIWKNSLIVDIGIDQSRRGWFNREWWVSPPRSRCVREGRQSRQSEKGALITRSVMATGSRHAPRDEALPGNEAIGKLLPWTW